MKVFKCLRCSDCCVFKSEYELPVVFPWEARRIRKYSGKQLFKPYLTYSFGDLHIVVLYKWVINGKCFFLNTDNSCRIHSEKPLACKIYPLLINLSDNTLRVSTSCRFVNSIFNELDELNPSSVFVEEYYNALLVFVLLKIIDEYALINEWRREILTSETDLQKLKYIDVDQVIDIDSLINNIKGSLLKYSEKPA